MHERSQKYGAIWEENHTIFVLRHPRLGVKLGDKCGIGQRHYAADRYPAKRKEKEKVERRSVVMAGNEG